MRRRKLAAMAVPEDLSKDNVLSGHNSRRIFDSHQPASRSVFMDTLNHRNPPAITTPMLTIRHIN